MAIISENDSPVLHRYSNTQFRYAMTYVVITFVVLLILNIYCSNASQSLFNQAKEKSMIEKCHLAADEIAKLEVISPSNVTAIASQLGSLKVTRLLVTDQTGMAIYDSHGTAVGHYVLFPEIIRCMSGNGYDVFRSQYRDGAMLSYAATPIITYGTTIGSVYMMEYDVEQGNLIATLQRTVLQVTLILEILLILFALIFSNTFSKRIRQIMSSMRIIQKGDYTHKVVMGGHDELTFLGDEFNDLTERLRTSEEKRRRFVSDASHELRTPLASIKLLTDSILQNDMDMETTREFVEDIGNEAERLNRMTAKLLSLTKLDNPPEDECEIINMAPTIERVVRMLSANAKQNQVTLTANLQKDSPILITEDDLYQIAFNLVENGIKYNVPNGTLTVTLLREDDNAILQVKDTGVGIPNDAISHIFERFYRVDKARSRATGGTGLGLAIVRGIVERNRGTIHVESFTNYGTTIRVTFPIFDTEDEDS